MLTWMTAKEKRVAAALVFVSLLSLPLDLQAQGRGGFITDGCKFARGAEMLASMAAFGLAFIPPMQPVAIGYGIIAIAAKVYIVARCD